MFMLRNFSRLLFGDASKRSIVEVTQGRLYLVRPLSVKGYSELIFKDATATICRTGQDFQYQLVVQHAYEVGEHELLSEGDEENSVAEGLSTEKDERTFILDQSLRFRTDVNKAGERVFAWKDLSGDEGDLWEFLCDSCVQPQTVATFERVATQCQFEAKYGKCHLQATEEDLQQFVFKGEVIPDASPASSPIARSIPLSTNSPRSSSSLDRPIAIDAMVAKPVAHAKTLPKGPKLPTAPATSAQPPSHMLLANETAELHLFDFESGAFVLQDHCVRVTVIERADWQYSLQITGDRKEWLHQSILPDINPVFNFEYLSFIFNHYNEDGSVKSWLLRFKSQVEEEHFQDGFMRALWEHLNQVKWLKAKEDERDYVVKAFQDLTTEDDAIRNEESDEENIASVYEGDDAGQAEHYDSNDEGDDVVTDRDDGSVNSQLAIGYRHDKSFVIRGSKIGVFNHTNDNQLQFDTNISRIETPSGKLFNPKKVMLHMEDQNMILQGPSSSHSLFMMDLERGKIVDEWKVDEEIPIDIFTPEKKFSQMTGEQTLLGLSHNALYLIDPRLAGNKLVDSSRKEYISKTNFTAAATTEKGYIAVASNKGDIRMFDRLGINAKTALPAIGDPIIGIDVSAGGRWILATTGTYLLLIDALQKHGKNEGKLGFERAFPKDAKPQPRRLALSPNHVAQFQYETKTPISLRPAQFNAGIDSAETTIVTATGPFVLTWSMKKVLGGRKDPYSIKRYAEEVKADNFRYGSDKSLIVALPNEVNMVASHALRRPTRESIAMPSQIGSPQRRGRGSHLSRSDVVHSPY